MQLNNLLVTTALSFSMASAYGVGNPGSTCTQGGFHCNPYEKPNGVTYQNAWCPSQCDPRDGRKDPKGCDWATCDKQTPNPNN
ncbi:uncharacterized protein CLUP02_14580 [Colletotrichum lupini]|uniref:Secreted protein n=1 Tax=Colletotrichum lupini TaxID=145971 RepID=A0A9Q8T4M6_9PEZI|nr:uncharacterized protein CLUP02_14580 [Colletotrichum lupini]KAK1701795.1 hypothetical protein BDP67DRAFT_625631 [Colletotrichum lupini]UQC89052.1 hypothetical protein CLUP02_14580 [Colletotrichum lupini]